MATIDERIANAEKRVDDAAKQLRQLKVRRDALEARKIHSLLKGQRAEDTRRKIIAGALVLEMMEKDETVRQRFMQRLDSYLTRPDERALFGLPAQLPTN